MAIRLATRHLAIKAAILVSVPFASQPSYSQQASDNPIAQRIADQIVQAYHEQIPLAPCRDHAFSIWPTATNWNQMILRGANRGDSPISIQLDPPVPISQIPPQIADVLNRIQDAGGSVKTQDEPGQEAFGAPLQYLAEGSLKAISAAASALAGAVVSQWASFGLSRYSATVYLTRNGPTHDLVDKVELTCVPRP